MTLELDKKSTALTFTPEKIKLLKDTVCKGATDAELELFMHICKHTGLDPFMKQIYSIPRGGQRTTQTSIDGFRLIAERTGRYAPGKETTFTYDEKGNVESATVYIKKMTQDGTWHEVAQTAFMGEFKGSTSFWTKLPRTMIAKVAESACLRRCFPAELSGLYTSEEMDQSEEPEDLIITDFTERENDLLKKSPPEKTEELSSFLSSLRALAKKQFKTKADQKYDITLKRFESDVNYFLESYEKWKKDVAENP